MRPDTNHKPIHMPKGTTVIPIASGKGGVGKSLLAANLAIALAKQGHPTVAVDMDLGGSNLHTYLGIPNKYAGIGDYLKGRKRSLDELILQTDIPLLRFLPGDGKTPFMANIPSGQRLVLLEKLLTIPTKYLIVDLGAGSSLNTMNFFGMTHKGVMVTTFETSAIMNCMMFLRNFTLANITSLVRQQKEIHDMLFTAFRNPQEHGGLRINPILKKVAEIDKDLAEKIRKKCKLYHPRIIFNMGDHPNDLNILDKIDTTLRKNLDMEAEYFGFIFYDEVVRSSVRKNQTIIPNHPKSLYAKCTESLADRIIKGWDRPVSESIKSLQDETRKQYAGWHPNGKI